MPIQVQINDYYGRTVRNVVNIDLIVVFVSICEGFHQGICLMTEIVVTLLTPSVRRVKADVGK